MPTKTNGAKIRRLREEQTGLSCRAFALKHQINPVMFWRIENNKRCGSPETRNRIAEALGVTLDDITYFVEANRPRKAAA